MGSAADLQAWAMQQPAVGRCMFCPEWEVEGTVEAVNALLHEHRASHHPECAPSKRKRPSRGLRLSFRQQVSEVHMAEIETERRRRMRELGIPDSQEPENL